MAQATVAYKTKSKYLFKTGFDSFVSGTLDVIHENELEVVNAQLQIPPNKIMDFIADGKEMKDVPVHSRMILPRINIDWAVPTK